MSMATVCSTLCFTTGNAAPAIFRNLGERQFRLTPLPGVNQPAYAMNWGDLDADGDLDLVTGAYDAGRQMETGSNYLFAAGAGVNVYTQGSGAVGQAAVDRHGAGAGDCAVGP
jgi:hypothetical protein